MGVHCSSPRLLPHTLCRMRSTAAVERDLYSSDSSLYCLVHTAQACRERKSTGKKPQPGSLQATGHLDTKGASWAMPRLSGGRLRQCKPRLPAVARACARVRTS